MNLHVVGLLAVTAGFLFQNSAPAQSSIQGNSANQVQQVESDKSRPPSDVDWEIENWLNDGPGAVQRLVGLGVDQKTAEESVDSYSDDDLHIQWKTVNSESKELLAALFLPCNGNDDAYLFAMQKANHAWQVTDREGFDCHYDATVSMEIARVHDPNRDEVLIHHVGSGHGTGFVQQNYNVFSIAQGKLKLRLDTVEVLDDHQPPEKTHDIVRRSTFTIIPILNSRSRAIEETRSSILNDHLMVQRRIFRWDPAKRCYSPTRFVPVEAASTN
jgi:hypothetical protein